MIGILVAIIVVGLLLWAANYAIPMEPMFKRMLTAVAVVCLVLYMLRAFGLFSGHFVMPRW